MARIIISFLIMLLGVLASQCGNNTDVSRFIENLKPEHVTRVIIYNKNYVGADTISVHNSQWIQTLCTQLKLAKDVPIGGINVKNHDRFYIISIPTTKGKYQDIELVRASNGEGIIHLHSNVRYLRNDNIISMLDSATSKTHAKL